MESTKASTKERCLSHLTKKTVSTRLEPMARRGIGSKGKRISLITNHFKVDSSNLSGHFYSYNVFIVKEDGSPVYKKEIKRLIMDGIRKTYATQLAGKNFAYDGNETLYTPGPLPHNKMEFLMVLENHSARRIDRNGLFGEEEDAGSSCCKRMKHALKSRTFKIRISFGSQIPIKAIANTQSWEDPGNCQDVLVVLNTILRQHAARKGCLLVGQRFFENEAKNFSNLGGGIFGCRGFYSSFQPTQSGLSINLGLSNTTIIQPGPVIDFLLANQNVKDCYQIDWSKAKRTLKNLKIKVATSNRKFRITGLSDKPCKGQTFLLHTRENKNNSVSQITVFDYFIEHHRMVLGKSGDLPCINVGGSDHPIYYPIELCSLLPLQRYTKKLSGQQRLRLVEKSSLRPHDMVKVITDELKRNNYNSDPAIHYCHISINNHLTQVEGRVLPAPRLMVGNRKDFIPKNGRWSYSNVKFFEPARIKHWAVVNFSSGLKVRYLCEYLKKLGEMKGMVIDLPKTVFEEKHEYTKAPSFVRVQEMFEQIHLKFHKNEPPYFILCLLPQRNKDIYGMWKRKAHEAGIFNQCLSSTLKVNEQCLTNVLLKINAKLGGLNSLVVVDHLPLVSKVPTIIFGMSLSHSSNNHQSDRPSVAAVVSSRNWPQISHYKASARIQSPRSEIIETLFKPVSEQKDLGMVRELLLDFYATSGNRKPEHIIIFREGIGESHFKQLLDIELGQLIQAFRCLDESWYPKVTIIASVRRHHTRFFQQKSLENVPPGIVIDNTVCHPHNYDFYMCPHTTIRGTTRPVHYHVLLDEIGFPVDELQELIHLLSYVYQRGSSAISEVAPVRYAHLAAAHMLEAMISGDMPIASRCGASTSESISFPALPKLHDNVRNSMFFC